MLKAATVSSTAIILYVLAGVVLVGSFVLLFVLDESYTLLIGVLLAIVLMFAGVAVAQSHGDQYVRQLYYTGCPNCGSGFELYQAVGHKSSTSFLYKCTGCGSMFESYELFTDVEVK